MPQIRLEYSTNIKEDPKQLFPKCHRVLVDVAKADLATCQSRAFPCDVFHIGDGSAHEAFIYLEIMLLEGRSQAQLQELGNQLQSVLVDYFSQSVKELNVQIAVRLVELTKSHYFKKVSRTQH